MSTEHETFEVVQEPDRVTSWIIVVIAIASIVVGVAAVFVSTALLNSDERRIGTAEVRGAASAPPVPSQLQPTDPSLIERERAGYATREAARRALQSYGWIDRSKGLAQIPIDRAIDLEIAEAKR